MLSDETFGDATLAAELTVSARGRSATTDLSDFGVLESLAVGETFLPSQLGQPSSWSPEKRLAGAVLAGALVEVRDYAGHPAYRRRVDEDLRWIFRNDPEWPYSFCRICDLFGLETAWVRRVVRGWLEEARGADASTWRPFSRAA
jgi:hypothetical protein